MKYTYYSTIKSGKHLMRSLFWLNNRSTCSVSRSKSLWASLSEPVGNLYKLEWYWCDKNNKLQYLHDFLDIKDRILSKRYYEKYFPIKNHLGYSCVHCEDWVTHENFWGCLDSILRRDLITNPFSLLGYFGKDPHSMINEMKSSRTSLTPHPNIIQQLRKRKGIVAYKEDIEHLAYNIFSVGAAGGFNTEHRATKIINKIRDFQKYMPIFLDKHKIPYEMFSLDTGDYGKTFELDKVLPRDSTQTLWDNNDESIDVRQQVSKYLIENP